MRILFDQGVPAPLRRFLEPHEVQTAYELGWAGFRNGDLLRAAELAGFGVFVTTDTHLKHEQNLAARKMAVVVLLSTSWPKISAKASDVASLITSAAPRGYTEIPI